MDRQSMRVLRGKLFANSSGARTVDISGTINARGLCLPTTDPRTLPLASGDLRRLGHKKLSSSCGSIDPGHSVQRSSDPGSPTS